jgi:hypothetical protein
LLVVEDFADAMMGTFYDHAVGEMRVAYDINKCIKILMEKDGWSEDEAIEWMQYNILMAYMGNDQPIFIENKLDGVVTGDVN